MLEAKLYIGGKEIGKVEIVNVTRCAGRISSDYYWRVYIEKLNGEKQTSVGLIVDSYNGNAMQLLSEVLNQWEDRENVGETALDNHGQRCWKAESMTMAPNEYWTKYDEYEKNRNLTK